MARNWFEKLVFGDIISPLAQEKKETSGFGTKVQELLRKKKEDFGQMIKTPFKPVSASGTVDPALQ